MIKQRQWKLENRLRELEGTRVDLSPMQQVEVSGDFGDEASRLSEQSVTAEISRSKRDEIQRIKIALQNGSDLCIDCDDEIHPKRLEARPESTLCLRCQTLAEGFTPREPRRLANLPPHRVDERRTQQNYIKSREGTQGRGWGR